VFQREAPKSPRSPENVRPQNVKIEASKSGAPNGFLFPVSARDPKSVGPQRVQGPQKQSPKIKKREAPKFKKRGSKSRAANKFICSFDSLGKGLQKARPSKSYRGQKISKFVVNCFNSLYLKILKHSRILWKTTEVYMDTIMFGYFSLVNDNNVTLMV
jgi:hypothetical protein